MAIDISELTEEFEHVGLGWALNAVFERGKFEVEERGENRIVAAFPDGLELAWQSECIGLGSPDASDAGMEPPTVWARRVQNPLDKPS